MTRLTNPVPLFLDARGALLDAGRIYIGAAGSDPRVTPIAVFWDAARALAATQPLRTAGGAIVNGGTRASAFTAADDYAIRVEDADGLLVDYVASAATAAPAYQPADADLAAIAQLGTTAFGRVLLTLADQNALREAVNIAAGLPLNGGTVTGAIVRLAAGVHTYHVNPAYTSGRIFGPENTTDPTTQPGDIWFKPNA